MRGQYALTSLSDVGGLMMIEKNNDEKGKRFTCTKWHTLEVFYRVPYLSARK